MVTLLFSGHTGSPFLGTPFSLSFATFDQASRFIEMMINTLYLPEIREMLATSDKSGLHEFCIALHPARTAEFMESLTSSEAWQVLLATELDIRIQIFGFLEEETQLEILRYEAPAETAELISEMPADDRVDLLKELSEETTVAILKLVPVEERRDIQRLTKYAEETAGSVMTTEIARLPETLTAEQALKELANQASNLETIYYIYIVDDKNHLRGLVSARQLVENFGNHSLTIADLMERNVVTVNALDDQETVATKVANYDFLAIPVVDDEQHLVGIITHDDIIDVLQEEADEDAYLAGAVEPLEESYLDTDWFTLTRHRAGWLMILFVGAFFTTFALQRFENVLDRITWLMLFLPLVISSGGNSGSQSATLIIRALTTHELTPYDWKKVLRRELLSGAMLGMILAGGGLFFGYFVASKEFSSNLAYLVLPLTLLLVVLSGTLIGSMMPLLLKRLGLDPALMSTPFVAGIIDLVGILVYIGTAMLLLPL